MNIKYFYILPLLFLSSCSNFLTWHLDKGIHKDKSPLTSTEISTVADIDTNYNISSRIIWTTSTNGGMYGNTAYLNMQKVNNIIYSVDTDGLISATSIKDGSIIWQVPTNYNVSSGMSVFNDQICLGTMDAKLACFNIKSLEMNSYIPLVSYIQN